MKNKFLSALAVLVGTTIGAGFLGIPYVVSQTGFLIGLACLLLAAILMFFVKLYLGEVILRTNGNHQLAGYAERYLGKWGKGLMFFSMVFGIYSALVAYMIGEGQTLSYIILGSSGYSIYFSLAFWLVMSIFTYIGLVALKKYEKIAMFTVLFFVFLICLFFFRGISMANLSYINPGNFFLPFGLMLFSFLAFSAMPEVERVLIGQEKLMKKTIFYGVLIPLAVYLVFMIVMVGNFGANIPEISVFALGRFFSVLAVLTMFTAFFALSLAIRDMFRFDFHQGRLIGWILASFIPLVLFVLVQSLGLIGFIQLLSLAGIISGGLTGILILLMNKKAKKEGNRTPEYSIPISWLVVLLFSGVFIFAVILQCLS